MEWQQNGQNMGKNTAREIKENIHRMHLCLQQQGAKTSEFALPLPGRRAGLEKQAGGKHKITHNDQRHVSINVDQQE